MKPVRYVLLIAFLIVGVMSALVYTSCKKDKCVDVACKNLGACFDGNCTCLAGYEGSRCDTLSRKKFIYTWNGADSCTAGLRAGVNQYPIYFQTIVSKPKEMQMKHFLNNWDDSANCTMQSTDSFTFTGNNNSTVYRGHGKLFNDTLKLVYDVDIDTVHFSCKWVGGR
jgi:hypothetical protein